MTDMYPTQTDATPRRLTSLAALHNEAAAAEADRIRATVPDSRISPSVRLAMGYTDSAHAAAKQLENEK